MTPVLDFLEVVLPIGGFLFGIWLYRRLKKRKKKKDETKSD